MKSDGVYDQLNAKKSALEEVGFTKKSKNTFEYKKNATLTFLLDRHGWDETYGWGFVTRIKISADGVPDVYNKLIDVRADTLLDAGLLNRSDFQKLYEPYALHEDFMAGMYGQWIVFYDSRQLSSLLELLLPLIARFAREKIETTDLPKNLGKRPNLTDDAKAEIEKLTGGKFITSDLIRS